MLCTQPAKIHFVCAHSRRYFAWENANQFGQPCKIISERNLSLPLQIPEEPALERRLGKQCSVNIKKGQAHAVSAEDFRLRGATTSCVKIGQPASSTGNPRNKQNAAVAQVRICAMKRMVRCVSAAIVPSSATGPRVNANSNPR